MVMCGGVVGCSMLEKIAAPLHHIKLPCRHMRILGGIAAVNMEAETPVRAAAAIGVGTRLGRSGATAALIGVATRLGRSGAMRSEFLVFFLHKPGTPS